MNGSMSDGGGELEIEILIIKIVQLVLVQLSISAGYLF